MRPQFAEKLFETAFNSELNRITKHVYSLDQHSEHYLGYDASAFLTIKMFASHFPYLPHSSWRKLTGISADQIAEVGKRLNHTLPPIRQNLFLQYKRSHYLTNSNAKEWDSWNKTYYRYEIEKKQQSVLLKLHQTAGTNAAVVYAAPAFHTHEELYTHIPKRTVLTNSNIQCVSLLNGHSKCTFSKAGSKALVHSEPEEIESPSFDELSLRGKPENALPLTFHLKSTEKIIYTTLEADPENLKLLKLAKRALISRLVDDETTEIQGTWLDAHITISAFADLFRLNVFGLSENKE